MLARSWVLHEERGDANGEGREERKVSSRFPRRLPFFLPSFENWIEKAHSRESSRPSTSSHTLVDSNQLNPISRLAPVDHIVLKHDLDTPWKLTCWSSFGHLLDRNRLLIPEGGESVLHRNDVTVSVVLGNGDGRRTC